MARRLILPRGCDGKLARQIGDTVGDEWVDQVREASRDFYSFLPVATFPAYAYKGELIPRVAGGAGFSSFSDLIAEATAGKRQMCPVSKIELITPVAGRGMTFWDATGFPAAGAAPSGLADAALTRATVGALGQQNPGAGDTLHLATQVFNCSTGPHTLLIYDRLNHFRPNANSNAAQNLTGTQARYNDAALSPGNFAFIEIASVLAATAHNWNGQYTDQDGNTAQAFGQITGVSAGAAGTFDMAASTAGGGWFWPLAGNDTGIRAITQVTLSAAVATGTVNVVLGHPLMLVPLIAANSPTLIDGINTALSLAEVKTDACLAFAMIAVGSATANPLLIGAVDMIAG